MSSFDLPIATSATRNLEACRARAWAFEPAESPTTLNERGDAPRSCSALRCSMTSSVCVPTDPVEPRTITRRSRAS